MVLDDIENLIADLGQETGVGMGLHPAVNIGKALRIAIYAQGQDSHRQ